MRFRRFRAADVRAILAAGPGAPDPAGPGGALALGDAVPPVPVRPLRAYALGGPPPALAPPATRAPPAAPARAR